MTANDRDLPIGYWLKHVDETITAHLGRVLQDEGLTRFHWQVLNLLRTEGATGWEELFAVMRTFVDEAGLDGILDDLAGRAWLARDPEAERAGVGLTEEGERAHQRVSARIAAVRRRAIDGISQDDYLLVVRTLQRMAANLAA
jgi:DNA-binding MarR family transcriptional regulator